MTAVVFFIFCGYLLLGQSVGVIYLLLCHVRPRHNALGHESATTDRQTDRQAGDRRCLCALLVQRPKYKAPAFPVYTRESTTRLNVVSGELVILPINWGLIDLLRGRVYGQIRNYLDWRPGPSVHTHSEKRRPSRVFDGGCFCVLRDFVCVCVLVLARFVHREGRLLFCPQEGGG